MGNNVGKLRNQGFQGEHNGLQYDMINHGYANNFNNSRLLNTQELISNPKTAAER
jgi:hypothetical protein